MSCNALGKNDPAVIIPTAIQPLPPIVNLPSSLLGEFARFNSYGATENFFSSCKKLQSHQSVNTHFHFPESSIDDDALIHILKAHKGPIFSIDLSNCENITGKSLEYIAERCPQLTALNLSECYQLSDADLASLSNLTHLKTVRLNKNDWLTGAGLKHLQALELETLELKTCIGLADEDLACVSSILTLKNLRLTGNDWLTGRGLIFLKVLQNLEDLELAVCSQLTDADLEQLSPCENLTSLDVSECERITGKFLAYFGQLTTLNLEHCTEFKGDFLADLSNLKWLNLTKCPITDEHLLLLRDSKKLINLNLTGCDEITDRGMEVLVFLGQLRVLDLTWCEKISNVALRKIGFLANLNVLHLACCNKITNSGLLSLLPLQHLHRLDLAHCNKLSDMGVSILLDMPRLSSLNLTSCKKIQSKKLPRLATPIHSRRKELHSPTVILEEISSSDSDTEKASTAQTSKSLPSACINEGPSLDFNHQSIDDDSLIAILETHTGVIHSISLRNCLNITEKSIAAIAARCPQLKSLDLSRCHQLENKSLLPLRTLPSLESLFLSNCEWLTGQGLQYLQHSTLKTLHLGSCSGLTNPDLAHLSGYKSLSALHLSGCEWLNKKGIAHVAQLTELNALYLNNCSQLKDEDFTPLAHLPNLTVFDLSWCENIRGAFLPGLVNLETLTLDFCSAFDGCNLRLTHLASLSLVNCPILDEHLEILSAHSQQLRILNLTNSGSITDKGLGFIAMLEHLRSLNVSLCDNISSSGIEFLVLLSELTELSVAGCTKVDDASLHIIKLLENLIFLDLSGCPNFSLAGLLFLKSLKELVLLKLNDCDQICASDVEEFHSAQSDYRENMYRQLIKDLPFEETEEGLSSDIYRTLDKYITKSTYVEGVKEKDPIDTGEI